MREQGKQYRKKKIAVFGIKTYPAFAGADRVVENIVDNLDEEFEFYIYLVNSKNRLSSTGNKHFIYLPALKGKYTCAFSFFFLCTIHLLFARKYDLIHAHNSDTGLFTYLLKLKYKRRILGTFHGNPYESAKWSRFAKWYLKISEYFFIKSCHTLTSVSPRKTADGRNVVMIPNGMEEVKKHTFSDYINSSIDYENLKIDKGKYILFAAGRLDRRKGLHYLLNAYLNEHIDYQLMIISDFSHDRDYSGSINVLINHLDNKNLVVVKKLLPKTDLFDVIINAKMVVFPSEIEAMSMFLLEVLACNTPLVCSDIESNIHIVGEDYKYLFKNKDVESLVKTMKTALDDMDTNAYKEHKGSDEIYRKYNWKKIVTDYSMQYRLSFES